MFMALCQPPSLIIRGTVVAKVLAIPRNPSTIELLTLRAAIPSKEKCLLIPSIESLILLRSTLFRSFSALPLLDSLIFCLSFSRVLIDCLQFSSNCLLSNLSWTTLVSIVVLNASSPPSKCLLQSHQK